MPDGFNERDFEELFLGKRPVDLRLVDRMLETQDGLDGARRFLGAIGYAAHLPAREAGPDQTVMGRLRWDVMAAVFGRTPLGIEQPAPMRLAAQTSSASAARGTAVSPVCYVHALFVDPSHRLGYIRPLGLRLIASDDFEVIPRIECDAVSASA